MDFCRDTFLDNGTIMSLENGRVLVGSGSRKWSSAPNNHLPAFYFPDFFLKNPQPWFHQESHVELESKIVLRELGQKRDFVLPKLEWTNLDRSHFIKGFNELQGLFGEKKLEKGVPFAFEFSPTRLSKDDLRQLLIHLLEFIQDQPLHIYGFWDEQEGILGATPELLFKVKEENFLNTHACAGTRQHWNLPANDKEWHEHHLVVQGISESLGIFGEVSIGELEILQLPSLSHLLTPISVKLHERYDFEKIVKALHPTPALGGFPKQASLDWLHHYQVSFDRGRFGAPAGYLYPQANLATCFVSIRNIQWNEAHIRIGAGCGVVAGSNSTEEWDEVNLKMQSIKRMLGL